VPKLPRVSSAEAIRALERLGFINESQCYNKAELFFYFNSDKTRR
jgi:hypothetical protein